MKKLILTIFLVFLGLTTIRALTPACQNLLALKASLDDAYYQKVKAETELQIINELIAWANGQILFPLCGYFTPTLSTLLISYNAMKTTAEIHLAQVIAIYNPILADFNLAKSGMTTAEYNLCMDSYTGYSCPALRDIKTDIDAEVIEKNKAEQELLDISAIVSEACTNYDNAPDATMMNYWKVQLDVLVQMQHGAIVHLNEVTLFYQIDAKIFSEIAMNMGLDSAAQCLNTASPAQQLLTRIRSNLNDYLQFDFAKGLWFNPVQNNQNVIRLTRGDVGKVILNLWSGHIIVRTPCPTSIWHQFAVGYVVIENNLVTFQTCGGDYLYRDPNNFNYLALTGNVSLVGAKFTIEFVH